MRICCNKIAVNLVVVFEALKVLVAFAPCAADSNKLCLARLPFRGRPLVGLISDVTELGRDDEHKWVQRGQTGTYNARCDPHNAPGARHRQCPRCISYIELHNCCKTVGAGEKHKCSK